MIQMRIMVSRATDSQVGLKLGWTSILSGLKIDSEVIGPLDLHRERKQKYQAGKESD